MLFILEARGEVNNFLNFNSINAIIRISESAIPLQLRLLPPSSNAADAHS